MGDLGWKGLVHTKVKSCSSVKMAGGRTMLVPMNDSNGPTIEKQVYWQGGGSHQQRKEVDDLEKP